MDDKDNNVSFAESASPRHLSPPPPGLRHRPLGRASTFAEPSLTRRRSSIFSETLSDAKKSIRSSTDDILLPRAVRQAEIPGDDEDSNWQSAGVGLALLPAVGSMFFKGGGDFITDVILLVIAAIFMHWSLRVPWEWYQSAQAIAVVEPRSSTLSTPVIEEEDEDSTDHIKALDDSHSASSMPGTRAGDELNNSNRTAAETELRLHELAALLCCFICPGLSAMLLHAIRAHLSRPSEGLVSNFNIAIFLMFAEVKPMSHLIKLILRRTVFLQRRVNLESLRDPISPAGGKANERLNDLLGRLEELEAHVANGIMAKDAQSDQSLDQAAAKASALAIAEVRKIMQPEIEALARAMRRYEKKSTISAVQNEGRLQQLEMKCADVVVLAASATRSVQSQPRQYYLIALNWIAAGIVIPVEMAQAFMLLPYRIYRQSIAFLARMMPDLGRSRKSKDVKTVRRTSKLQADKRGKLSS